MAVQRLSLRALETRGWIVIGRSAGGKADYLMRTLAGQKWATQLTASCD
jgi:hypothetical protein